MTLKRESRVRRSLCYLLACLCQTAAIVLASSQVLAEVASAAPSERELHRLSQIHRAGT